MASYGDKSDEVTFYDLGILINKDGVMSVLDLNKQDPEKFKKRDDEIITNYVIKRGKTKFGITLDNNGKIKYGHYVLPAKIEGMSTEKYDASGTLCQKQDMVLIVC